MLANFAAEVTGSCTPRRGSLNAPRGLSRAVDMAASIQKAWAPQELISLRGWLSQVAEAAQVQAATARLS